MNPVRTPPPPKQKKGDFTQNYQIITPSHEQNLSCFHEGENQSGIFVSFLILLKPVFTTKKNCKIDLVLYLFASKDTTICHFDTF